MLQHIAKRWEPDYRNLYIVMVPDGLAHRSTDYPADHAAGSLRPYPVAPVANIN